MMFVIHDPHCADYQTPGHPEAPFRVRDSATFLREKHPDWTWSVPVPAPDEAVLRAHRAEHLRQLREGGEDFDGDTPDLPGIEAHARRGAGAALETGRLALEGKKAFSLMRPPGHHATPDRAMGFCYLNQIAIAALEAVAKGLKVGIYDFDAHHGNGTEDIVMGHDKIRFASVHQFPGYPGTGTRSQKNCFNWPVRPMTPHDEHLRDCRTAWEKILEFQPDLILVSAGFDAYVGDPITEMTLERGDFAEIGRWLHGCPVPVGCILEGGYSRDLPGLIDAFLTAWETGRGSWGERNFTQMKVL
ncbi:MAG: histone deacetylase [Verrucomicrobiae bacterium]|nr:histone deacetylase [Verrucomicrobiae bacterium]